jgi:hypothetical protein
MENKRDPTVYHKEWTISQNTAMKILWIIDTIGGE